MDAFDALFCFGFEIVRGNGIDEAGYKLADKNSDLKYTESIKLLFKEINEGAEYYAKEIRERGDKM